jgi:phosphohistidine phosphatase SixA
MSVEVIFVRHAVAARRSVIRWRDDKQRPLTSEGRRKFRKAAAVLAILRRQKAKRIALVGREPDLSRLLSICIAGPDVTLPIGLKKGGIACIAFSRSVGAGKATLTAIIPPRALRAM